MGAFEALSRNPYILLILVLIIVVVFGSSKLPGAARSLGRSLRIFQSEMKGMQEESSKGSSSSSTQALTGDVQDTPKAKPDATGTGGTTGRDS